MARPTFLQRIAAACACDFRSVAAAAWTLLGAFVAHLPGIACQFRFPLKWEGKLRFLLGGIAEGVLLLLLVSRIVRFGGAGERSLLPANKSHHRRAPSLLARALALAIVACFVLVSAGDQTWKVPSWRFRRATEWIVQVGFRNCGEYGLRLTESVAATAAGLAIQWRGCRYRTLRTGRRRISAVTWRAVVIASVVALFLYTAGCWLPVIHTILSAVVPRSLARNPDFKLMQIVHAALTSSANSNGNIAAVNQAGAPSVVYVQAESMSGLYALTERGRASMPFLHSLLASDDSMHLFPNSRSPSGDTVDCMTSLMTGCLPYTEKGIELAFSKTIGVEFRSAGYQTISVSSRRLDMAESKWWMLQNYLTVGMDKVYDPESEGYPLINSEGSEDAMLFPHFEHWMKNERNESRAFYAQVYLFNTHWPYVCHNCKPDTPVDDRLYASLRTTDDFLRDLFRVLKETGRSDDTIIVFSGDHGEYLPKMYFRLNEWSPHVLQPLTAIYAPEPALALAGFPGASAVLKHNEDKVVSTLDLYPTLWNILYNRTNENVLKDDHNCITGLNLMGTRISDDRLAFSYNYVSKWETLPSVALSNSERGIYWFREGKNKLLEMHFDESCSKGIDSGPCTSALTMEDKTHWQDLLDNNTHPFMKSKVILDLKKII